MAMWTREGRLEAFGLPPDKEVSFRVGSESFKTLAEANAYREKILEADRQRKKEAEEGYVKERLLAAKCIVYVNKNREAFEKELEALENKYNLYVDNSEDSEEYIRVKNPSLLEDQ